MYMCSKGHLVKRQDQISDCPQCRTNERRKQKVTRYAISAMDERTGERVHLFTWIRSPESGIARAKVEADRHGCVMTDFEARPLGEQEAVPCREN